MTKTMRVAVNALSLRDAGGRSVALNFLRAAADSAPDIEFNVIAPPDVGYEQVESANVAVDIAPAFLTTFLMRPFADALWLPRRLLRSRPDVVFSMGNIAVDVGLTPQLLLFHWPYAIYPESPVWSRMSRRSALSRRMRLRAFQRGLRHATRVCAQTSTARERLERLFGMSDVVVVPNAVSLPPPMADSQASSLSLGRKPTVRLLCLSRYYPHKNLEVLLEVAELARASSFELEIITTIASDQDAAAAHLLRRVESRGLAGVLRNIGPVAMSDVPSLYSQVDGLILPTLLESFSGTYIEAMHFQKSVLTSDMDFARDVCGDVAYYFDPLSATSIFHVIRQAFSVPSQRLLRIEQGRQRVQAMPDWLTVATMFASELRRLAAPNHGVASG